MSLRSPSENGQVGAGVLRLPTSPVMAGTELLPDMHGVADIVAPGGAAICSARQLRMANNVLVQLDCALTSGTPYRGERGKLWARAYFTP
jgi:hypothetical protein